MRNWNFSCKGTKLVPYFCFYSTYEELKPQHMFVLLVRFICFYSTYEELKLKRLCRLIWALQRFYSTYEELKPPPLIQKLMEGKRFLQYLWGIETLLQPYTLHIVFRVFTVPMRNWNFLLHHTKNLKMQGFYSTYEELKQSIAVCNASKMSGFLQYLWGIETLFQLIFSVWFPVFLQYLWGNVMCLFLPHLVR